MPGIRYLLDTNAASHVLRGGNPVVDRHAARVPMGEIAVSVITEAELRYGGARKPQAAQLHRLIEFFLSGVTILSWDSTAAREYATLRATLERHGRPMGTMDMLIAAHALALGSGIVLVTADHAFARVKGLNIEDWTKTTRGRPA